MRGRDLAFRLALRDAFRLFFLYAALATLAFPVLASEPPGRLNELAAVQAALRFAEAERHSLERELRRLEARMANIEKRAQIHVVSSEFAQSLVDVQISLPDAANFRSAKEYRLSILQRASTAQLQVAREMDELVDRQERLRSLQQAGAVDGANELESRRHVLAQTYQAQTELIESLHAADRLTDKLLHAAETGEARLKQILFWIPAPVGSNSWEALLSSLLWTVSPDNWRAAAGLACEECHRERTLAVGAFAIIAVLVLFRGRMRRSLYDLVARSADAGTRRKGDVLRALTLTALLPAPLPLAMLAVGLLVDVAPGDQTFSASLGDALLAMSRLVYATGLLLWLIDPRGIAAAAGRDRESVELISRALRSFMPWFIAVLFVAALNGLDDAPFSNRESLGRSAFIVAMLMVAWRSSTLFHSRSALVGRLREHSPRSWLVQFHTLWFAALLILPLLLSGFAVAGYFIAAEYFFGHLLGSFYILLGAVTLRDFLYLWALDGVPHGRLPRPAAGRKAINEEIGSLVNLLLIVVVLVALWVLWREGLPVLAAIGSHVLYSYTTTVNGASVTHPLTVEGFAVGMLVAIVTAAIVRNIGGFLDFVFLRRIEIQEDAALAIKVVARYLIIMLGVFVASGALGLGWEDVQWMVAALSVGIGFGLQEIFGNLVAGLMMLAERPVRIGDIVTVGDITGTVTRIQARATTVTDFDNKEILIPNKSFITDRVINWTLSSQTTRLLLKVSVPRGTDVGRAQQILFDVVQSNPDVSTALPPAVLCLGLVDKSLEFEVSAFVDSFDRRRRVQHELNSAIDRALRESGIVS